jgi:DNA primase large subunit
MHPSSTVVARGAVLQAVNKVHGMKRTTLCSYGFLRDEQWDPEEIPAHYKMKPDIDRADGERYIRNTIDWLINKVCAKAQMPSCSCAS